jgi:hypothetical protein
MFKKQLMNFAWLVQKKDPFAVALDGRWPMETGEGRAPT